MATNTASLLKAVRDEESRRLPLFEQLLSEAAEPVTAELKRVDTAGSALSVKLRALQQDKRYTGAQREEFLMLYSSLIMVGLIRDEDEQSSLPFPLNDEDDVLSRARSLFAALGTLLERSLELEEMLEGGEPQDLSPLHTVPKVEPTFERLSEKENLSEDETALVECYEAWQWDDLGLAERFVAAASTPEEVSAFAKNLLAQTREIREQLEDTLDNVQKLERGELSFSDFLSACGFDEEEDFAIETPKRSLRIVEEE